MNEEIKESSESTEKKEKINITDKIRENPWILSTVVASVVIILMLILNFSGLTGNVVSSQIASDSLINYLNNVADSEVKLIDVKDTGNMYLVTVEFKGNKIPVYMTKDGKYYTSNLVPISDLDSSANQRTQEIPKSDKPNVELYVFTYCPYGLQMEKAIMPVVNLLKDKIEFKIRQIGAMHGEYEKIEAERQLCIEKNYPDKFLDYVLAFAEDTGIGNCNDDATCLIPKLNALYSKLGIDASKINSCMTSEGEKLYNAEIKNANEKDISGSPTLVINDINVQSERNPEAVKILVCSAFNNVPSECSQKLSVNDASPGFGSETSTINTHASESC